MCGIFGLIIKPHSDFTGESIAAVLLRIANLSESRGKDSSGIAFRNEPGHTIHIIKGNIPINKLLKSKEFRQNLKKNIEAYSEGYAFTVFGHARLVTNGSQLQEENNQPVLKDNIVIIHNGIIVNVDELWQKHSDLRRDYIIDTEIIPALIRMELNKQKDVVVSCNKALRQLQGTWSIAAMYQDLGKFVIATNNGSLYYISDNQNFILFASEGYFLQSLVKESCFKAFSKARTICQIQPNHGLVVNLPNLEITNFNTNQADCTNIETIDSEFFKIQKHLLQDKTSQTEVIIEPAIFYNRPQENHLYKLLENNIDSIKNLKRCTKCLLPETFPFIIYDHKGVCNYCNNYKPRMKNKGLEELISLVEPYRHKDKSPDCIVPFSGGRDSTYSLHIIKTELGLNPIAFTYDWGMVTDLARRNIARVCGKLGVENIIVSADLRWKRENIKKNINAWLKNPDLGMIPLFMAGDKYFFYYCNQVKKQTGIDLNIWGINYLENTDFKSGFAGLHPKFNKRRIYSLSIKNQIKLFGFVGSNIIKSPSYLNQSIFDSLGSFATRYISPKKDYFHLFDYYKWDENEINELIKNEYKWETAIDTKSTWRIGDGTASFYNYIYYTVAGFSENDTFRSNQVREGMLSREEAMGLIEQDNLPRYETLRWYLEIIGLDFYEVIKRINKIPKLYPL